MKEIGLEAIKAEFEKRFNSQPLLIKGCGRINIIGEHTDYNNGYVMPASIDKGIYFAISENGTTESHFYAANLGESYSFSIDDIKPCDLQWANYLMGIMDQLQKQNILLEGIDLVFGGDLPVGAGMSSSAALECGFALGLCSLFNLDMSRQELAQLAQKSSHEFLGIPCGIMDQFASLLGLKGQVIKLDCRSLNYEYIPIDLKDYDLLLVNSNISHDHVNGAYRDRVEECRKGVSILQQYNKDIQSLRDVKMALLDKHQEELGALIYRRCAYVVKENQRLKEAGDCLGNGKLERLGELLFETHEGLSKEYEVSCPELDFLVDFAKNYEGVLGARLMGGGFGGCTINLIHQDIKKKFSKAITKAYYKETGIDTTIYEVEIADGTRGV